MKLLHCGGDDVACISIFNKINIEIERERKRMRIKERAREGKRKRERENWTKYCVRSSSV